MDIKELVAKLNDQLASSDERSQALKRIHELAATGDAEANFWLGRVYENGESVEANVEKAMSYYRLSADSGSTAAQYNLGLIYFRQEDFTPAIQLLQQAAEAGEIGAMGKVGYLLEKGLAGSKDVKAAAEFYFKGASKGSLACAADLAWLIGTGESTRLGKEEMADLLEQLVEQEKADGWFELSILQEDESKKWRLMEKASSLGDPRAMEYFGEYVGFWTDNSPETHRRALKLLGDAATRGRSRAKYLAAALHARIAADFGDQTIERNRHLELAFNLASEAANDGSSDGMCMLGQLYRRGEGVERNTDNSVRWLKKAIENGCERAQKILDDVILNT